MKFRSCHLLILIIGLIVSASLLTSRIEAGDRPNVLFISIDDLNDWIGEMGGNPQALTPLHELVPGIDPQLADIVMRTLELRPADRFQSASEMLAAIDGEMPALLPTLERTATAVLPSSKAQAPSFPRRGRPGCAHRAIPAWRRRAWVMSSPGSLPACSRRGSMQSRPLPLVSKRTPVRAMPRRATGSAACSRRTCWPNCVVC